ncbi:hypothetical protein BDQ17DRAFT_1364569 [Cyathus striatus]|nr:hypothetical protein BDQ17DRAFT_1364569 [Cyathus striatus]
MDPRIQDTPRSLGVRRIRAVPPDAPIATVDPECWIAYWEQRISDESLNTCTIINTMSPLENKSMDFLLTLARYRTSLIFGYQHQMTDYLSTPDGDIVQHIWRSLSSSERRKHMLEGMVRSAIADPESQPHKAYCSDLTLYSLEKNQGELFIKLLYFYVAPDLSTFTSDQIKSYPHPNWSGEMQKEIAKDKSSKKALLWELIQLDRDGYICDFIENTLGSLDGIPRPSGHHPVSKHVLKKKLDHLAQQFGSDFDRRGLQAATDAIFPFYEQNPNAKRFIICEYCYVTDVPLRRCKRCLKNVHRQVHYCSVTATKSQTTRFLPKFGRPGAGISRSPELEKQISLLNIPANSNNDYFLFTASGSYYNVSFSYDPTLKMAFEEVQYSAFVESNEICIAMLAQHLYHDLTLDDILHQLMHEFPLVPITTSIKFLTGRSKKIPRGVTWIEYKADLLQAFWDEEFLNPENGFIEM